MTVAPVVATTCSDLRALLGESVAGSAPEIRSWLLLEHPGPWGESTREDAFRAALGEQRWARLRALWEEQKLRPLLARRPRRADRRSPSPRLLVGSAVGARPFLEQLPAEALPELDLEALAYGEHGHGERVDGPLFAVCTNGAVDRCCAVRGRPLVAALAEVHPERTWEVTHVGGCRFAANLLVLPQAVVHGGVTPEAGLAIADGALRDQLLPGVLRGRTTASPAANVADVELRRRLGLLGADDVTVVAEHHADVQSVVLLRAPDRHWRAVVRLRPLGTATSVCDGTEEHETRELVALDPV